jgi:hypothetical protein
VPAPIKKAIIKLADKKGLSESEMIAALVEKGLEAMAAPK